MHGPMQTPGGMQRQWRWGTQWWQWNDKNGMKDYTSIIPPTLQEEWRWYDAWCLMCEDPEDHRFSKTRKIWKMMWVQQILWKLKRKRRWGLYEQNVYCHKVKTLRITSLSEWRSRWLKHEMRLMKTGMKGSMGRKIIKKEMENSKMIMCHFQQSLWWGNKGKTQKKKVPPNLYAVHAKCVTILPEDIQNASQYPQWKKVQGRKIIKVSMVQSWNRTISMVQN